MGQVHGPDEVRLQVPTKRHVDILRVACTSVAGADTRRQGLYACMYALCVRVRVSASYAKRSSPYIYI